MATDRVTRLAEEIKAKRRPQRQALLSNPDTARSYAQQVADGLKRHTAQQKAEMVRQKINSNFPMRKAIRSASKEQVRKQRLQGRGLVRTTGEFVAEEGLGRAASAVGEAVTNPIDTAKGAAKIGFQLPGWMLGGLTSVGRSGMEFGVTKLLPWATGGVLGETEEEFNEGLDSPLTKSIDNYLFGYQAKSWQSYKDDMQTYVDEHELATDWEKSYLPLGLAVAGFAGDAAFGFGKSGSKLSQEAIENLAKQTDRTTIVSQLRKDGVPKEIVDRAADDVVKASDSNSVTVALERAAKDVQARIPAPPRLSQPLDAKGRKVLGTKPAQKITQTTRQALNNRLRSMRSAAKKASQAARRDTADRKDVEKANALAKKARETELQLLRQRIKDRTKFKQQGARTATAQTKREIGELQTDYTKYVKNNLPKSLRGGLLANTKNINTAQKLEQSVEKATRKIEAFEQARALQTRLGKKRSKISFINKMNDLDQRAVRDVKQTLDLKKPLRQMNETELDLMTAELMNRAEFKRSLGAVTPKEVVDGKIAPKTIPNPRRLSNDELNALLSQKKPSRIGQALSNSLNETKKVLDIGAVMSSELSKISPRLAGALKNFDARVNIEIQKSNEIANRYFTKLKKGKKKLTNDEYRTYNFSLANGAIETAEDIARKGGFLTELRAVQADLEKIRKMGEDIGLEIGIVENYMPRLLKDTDQARKLMNDYFSKGEGKTIFDKALREKEAIVGRPLNDAERTRLMSNLFRGFIPNKILLEDSGHTKSRAIQRIPAGLEDAYEDHAVAVNNYLTEMITRIEGKRFLGAQMDDAGRIIDEEVNLANVLEVMTRKEAMGTKLSQKDLDRAVELIKARFNGPPMNKFFFGMKNLGYATLMNSIGSTVVQLVDLTWTIFENGIRSPRSMFAALSGRALVTAEEVGLKRQISAEFTRGGWTSAAVQTVFKLNLLQRVDNFVKTSTLDASVRKARRQLGNKKTEREVKEHLTNLFGDNAQQVAKELRNGEMTDNVRILAFARLSDFQPVSLSEMPVAYLKLGNGRIFYQMLSFYTKQLDVVRREAYREMKKGNYTRGVTNLAKLVAMLTAANATAQEIQDFLYGRPATTWSARTGEAFMSTFFNLSRYTRSQIERESVFGTIVGGYLEPPVISTLDYATADIREMWKASQEPGEVFTLEDSKAVRAIPVGGQMYYWHAGKGEQSKESIESRLQSENILRNAPTARPRSSGSGSGRRERSSKSLYGSSDSGGSGGSERLSPSLY